MIPNIDYQSASRALINSDYAKPLDHIVPSDDTFLTNWSIEQTIESVEIENIPPQTPLRFALTKVGDYVVSTLQDYDLFETQILSTNMEDKLRIGNYRRKTFSAKTALEQHIEAIWHVHHSSREGF